MNGSYSLAAATALLLLVAPLRSAVAQEVEVQPAPAMNATAGAVDIAGTAATADAPVASAPAMPLSLGVLRTGGQLSPFTLPTVAETGATEQDFAVQGRSRIALSNMLMIGGGAAALIGLAVIGGEVGGITALAGTGVAVYGLYLHFR
jgi:hypothetical protein